MSNLMSYTLRNVASVSPSRYWADARELTILLFSTSSASREALMDRKITPCIPGRKSRDTTVKYDKRRYRKRNRIKIMFWRLKDWRRVATRDDRSPTAFLSAIALAAAVIFWLWALTLGLSSNLPIPASQ